MNDKIQRLVLVLAGGLLTSLFFGFFAVDNTLISSAVMFWAVTTVVHAIHVGFFNSVPESRIDLFCLGAISPFMVSYMIWEITVGSWFRKKI